MVGVKISLYLLVFVLSNLIVLHFGSVGLIFTALLLIPFDFVMRCIFHETWKGKELIIKLGMLVLGASALTFLINHNSLPIALASSFGFISAQIGAGLFYQKFIDKSPFFKVNGSDLVGISLDSLVFQIIAFGTINPIISITQILLKAFGGLLWYWILFKIIKIKI